MRRRFVVAISLALGACATAPNSGGPVVALTIDDLPLHRPIPRGQTPLSVSRTLITALQQGGATNAMGFVNGHWTSEQPDAWQVLEEWRRAGLAFGNHSWSHANVNQVSLAEYEREIARNEPVLQRAAGGTDWHWFRYPFLAEGDDPARRAQVRQLLARRGYRIAAVTMDFSDWQYTAPYARCADKADRAAIADLEGSYLRAAQESITFARSLSRQLYGRDIPYVVLLHGGAFTARMMPRLLSLYRANGFRFASIAEAERDPVYREDVDPGQPARAQSLEARAGAAGFPLPARTDLSKSVETVCR